MSSFLSKRAGVLPYSGIREIYDLAGKMEDVIHFEIGEPDFDTPKPIIEAALQAASEGMTHYTSSGGIQALRTKIARKLSEELKTTFSPGEIVVTSGAMEALLLAMLVTLDQGDELLLPAPHWPNYSAHAMIAGADIRPVRLEVRDEFKPSLAALEQAVTERSKALLLNYPHNPTGATLEKEDLLRLTELVEQRDLLVFSDEAYADLVFDGASFCSIASLPRMKERTIVIRTFSKSYAMTGWRVGYLAGPQPVAEKAAKLHEHTTACTSSVSQLAAMTALDLPADITAKMVAAYERRRDLLLDGLRQIPGIAAFKPKGTFYVFADVTAFGVTSLELSRFLLEQAHVAVAPGSAFGPEGEGFIRICFANSTDKIREGVSRMKKALRGQRRTRGRR